MKYFIGLLILTLTICVHGRSKETVTAYTCPSSYWHLYEETYPRMCYRYFGSSSYSTKYSWEQCKQFCKDQSPYKNGTLAKIRSAAMDFQLTAWALEDGFSKTKDGFWIGANDLTEEGYFVWDSDKSSISKSSYTNWQAGQPDNKGTNGAEEDCVSVVGGDDLGKWQDNECHLNLGCMCQQQAET